MYAEYIPYNAPFLKSLYIRYCILTDTFERFGQNLLTLVNCAVHPATTPVPFADWEMQTETDRQQAKENTRNANSAQSKSAGGLDEACEENSALRHKAGQEKIMEWKFGA